MFGALKAPNFKVSGYVFVAFAGLVIAIYGTLLWQLDDAAHLGMSALFGLAIASLLWDKRQSFESTANVLNLAIGGAIMGWGVIQALAFPSNWTLRLLPLIGGFGLAVAVDRLQGMRRYWRELAILFFLAVPQLVMGMMSDISPITAKFSAFLMWYLGFDVVLQDVFIVLPNGAVKVYEACSGLENMCYLLGVAVVALLMFPLTQKRYNLLIPFLALVIGFIVNAIRVIWLAVLVNQGRQKAFDFWHDGDGSLVVGMVGVMILGAIYYGLLNRQPSMAASQIDQA